MIKINTLDNLELRDGIWQIQKIDNVCFLHADNMAFLRWCKEQMMFKHFHVGIVDPPYGIDVTKMNLGATKDSKPREYERGEWDGSVPTQEYWDLLWYCCRHLVIWGGNYFTDKYGQTTNDGTPAPISAGRCFYAWDKKAKGMSFADAELAITTFDSNARIIQKSRNSKEDDDGDKRHDTQKPIYLYDYIHLDQDLRGKKVLDTHGGSFSHAVAAYRNRVNLTIMDKQKSYYESGIENYKNATMKKTLF
jgi:site-specific DNA-methyltransferase (adenine-specific)